jgi:SAM-dependent methyltransferase
VHRDYAAHFFRWGWVSRQVKAGARVLDVGCGQDQPMLYTLGQRMQTVPELYVGVDLNRLMKKSSVRWSKIHDEFDFVNNATKLWDLYGHSTFDVAVCLEVIEHMGVEDGFMLLKNLFYGLKPGGVLYLSTPVFNGSAAANHIHEYTIPELKEAIEKAGFTVERRIGTFASKPEIVHAMRQSKNAVAIDLYGQLEEWFGGDVMATFMAALYPDASRNNMWVCRKP